MGRKNDWLRLALWLLRQIWMLSNVIAQRLLAGLGTFLSDVRLPSWKFWAVALLAWLYLSGTLVCNFQIAENLPAFDGVEYESPEINVSLYQNITDMDRHSELRIEGLHPKIRTKVREFIKDAEKQGIVLRITSGLRTWEEQNKLFAQGRTAGGKRVTNAKGGQSWHNYGLAIDVVQMVAGVPQWRADWAKIGEIGEKHGFEWGGRWKFVDKPHFQMRFGLTIAQAQARHRDKGKNKCIEI